MILALQKSIKSSTNPNIHEALLQYPSIIKYLGDDIKTDETLMKQLVSIKGKYLGQAKFKFHGKYRDFNDKQIAELRRPSRTACPIC